MRRREIKYNRKKLEYGKVYDCEFRGIKKGQGIYIGRLSNRTMSFRDVMIFRNLDDGKPYVCRVFVFKKDKNKLNLMEMAFLNFKNDCEKKFANKLLEKAKL